MAASGQTIKGSFGLDVGPLRAAAREAAIIGRKIKKDMEAVLSFSLKLPAKALIGSLNAVAAGVKALGAAAVVAGGALAVGVHQAYDLGRELNELSGRTGIAAGELAVLRQAFEDAGESADDVGPAINKMQRFIENAAQGGIKARDTFMGLGIVVQQLQAMTPDQQFQAIGNAIAGIQDPALRAADAMAIFGRSGGQFLALFGDHGIYDKAAATLGKQADILSANAAVFSQIAVSLSHVGVKLQGFFVGVAARVSTVIAPLLDRFEGIDLSGIGQKFGDGLIKGVQFVVGAFQNPKAFIGVATDALMYGVLSAGNALLAGLKAAKEYFQSGMLETIQGIGDTLLAVLVKAFAIPIAYLQANIADILSRLPTSLGGSGEKAAAQKDYDDHMAKAAVYQAEAKTNYGKMQPDLYGPVNQKFKALGDKYIALFEKERGAALAAKAVMAGQTIDQRAQALLAGGGPSISTARGSFTADQLLANGTAEIQSGMGKAGTSFGNIHIPDVLGAAKYAAPLVAAATQMTKQGEKTMKAAGIAAPTPAKDPWARYKGWLTFGGPQLSDGGGVQGAVGGLDNGHGGLGGAYNRVRRGDAARARAAANAAKQQGKEPIGIADDSVTKLAKAIGKELEVQ